MLLPGISYWVADFQFVKIQHDLKIGVASDKQWVGLSFLTITKIFNHGVVPAMTTPDLK